MIKTGLIENITVSVVIPYYENGDTIARALRSVVEQTAPINEIIVVDDCSTEPIDPQIISDMAIPVVILRHAARHGGSAARNSGIDAATSHYVAFLDADDLWYPDKIRLQLDAARTARQATFFVASNCAMIGATVRDSHNMRPPRPGEDISHYLLVAGGALQTSTLLVPAEFARAVRFRPGLRRHQDWDFAIRMARAGGELLYDHRSLSAYDVSERPGRISRQAKAFARTVEWMKLVRPIVPAAYLQIYFTSHCLSRDAMRHPLLLALAIAQVIMLGRLTEAARFLARLVVHLCAATVRNIVRQVRGRRAAN